ncbi:MAG: IS1380 family transposase [Acidimicrobiales bacterium]
MTTDGEGLVSHAGAGLLAEMADRSGLTEALSVAMGGCGISWRAHDPGVVVSHLAVAIADGADCLSDLTTLREQPELFGPVASQATAWRAVEAVTAPELRGIARAAATARERVWAAAGGPATITLDFDATLVTAHSDKQDAAATYKRGFGFHPLAVWLDETAEPLAAMLRPGNAGANNAADHVRLLGEAIDALPGDYQDGHRRGGDPGTVRFPLLVRADSAGATHDFLNAVVARNAQFSVGFAIDTRVRDAIVCCQEEDWIPAVNRDGGQRPNGYVIELTKLITLDTWPPGTRLICRRERPHPGAQLTMFDTVNGWRHTCFITNTPGTDLAGLEIRHRGHARVEDRVRNWKNCGLANLPFEDFTRNQAWTAISLLAGCLLAWTQHLCLDGHLAKAEPKTLRYRLLHVAARLVTRSRQTILRIDQTWPWRHDLATAYTRLRTGLP